MPTLRLEGGNASHAAARGRDRVERGREVVGLAQRLGVVEHRPRPVLLRQFDGTDAGFREQSLGLELRDPHLVRRRPAARRPPRGEPEPAALLVERAHRAVDPAEAQRLLDRLLVADELEPRPRSRPHQPRALRGAMVLVEPRTPGRGIRRLHLLAVVERTHAATLSGGADAARRRPRGPWRRARSPPRRRADRRGRRSRARAARARARRARRDSGGCR